MQVYPSFYDINRIAMRNPKALVQKLVFSCSQNRISDRPYCLTHVQTYVEVYMKWKKDPSFDSIDSIHKSLELKPIIAVKNFFISSSQENYSIPISVISKKGLDFGISIKVARFLRNYPSFFEEFKGPLHDLPWFRLTDKAIELHKQEKLVYQEFRDNIIERLKKLILMSGGSTKMLPLKVIKGLRWNLGLPDEFFNDPLGYIGGGNGCFEIVDIEDGLKALTVLDEGSDGKGGKVLSMMQKNAMKRGVYGGGADEAIAFPLYPSKGLRLKQKIKVWLSEFQKLPYVSPYDDPSCLNPDSDISEKRVVGLLHELLCLFVENAAERKTLFCLKKPLMLPQKVHKAFERHPHMFYLSLKNKTCTAILKEAYCDNGSVDPHPLAKVRKSYIGLMKESAYIMRSKRMKNTSIKASDEENEEFDDESSHLSEA